MKIRLEKTGRDFAHRQEEIYERSRRNGHIRRDGRIGIKMYRLDQRPVRADSVRFGGWWLVVWNCICQRLVETVP